jgi:hypothetical protein
MSNGGEQALFSERKSLGGGSVQKATKADATAQKFITQVVRGVGREWRDLRSLEEVGEFHSGVRVFLRHLA